MGDQPEGPDDGGATPHRRPSLSRAPFAWPAFLASRRQRFLACAAVACVALGAVLALVLGGGASAPPTPPRPVAETSVSPPRASSGSHPNAHRAPFRCRTVQRNGLARPVRVCIPSIRVDANVMSLGLNHDRTVQVPPLSRVGEAGWYRYSAQPGTTGPTVILGHVDSAQYGDGVFFHLSRLRQGDTVTVTSGDGRVATYRVGNVREVSKNHFPTQDVYGATSGPAIRLVTCGGRFDASTGSYLDNIIVSGTLVSTGRST